jgi:hypothetical protein
MLTDDGRWSVGEVLWIGGVLLMGAISLIGCWRG